MLIVRYQWQIKVCRDPLPQIQASCILGRRAPQGMIIYVQYVSQQSSKDITGNDAKRERVQEALHTQRFG